MAIRRVGLVYDDRMCKHEDPYNPHHPEKPQRISSIAERLKSAEVFQKCIPVEAREATDDELATVHTQKHVTLMRKVSSNEYSDQHRRMLSRRYNSIYFNRGSSESALLATGSVVELCLRVAKGDIEAGAAVVRPPGHHAEADSAMGFCLFNNVAVAAHVLVHGKQDLGIQKVMIVDWDVHHGNGIQNMFWNDQNVLYFSVHRYDNGSFYPMGTEGNFDKIGGSDALGFNVNVPWPHGGFGDLDYLAVWDHLLLPIAKDFQPDMVLISGGFDSAEGDPLGGCCLTPYGYAEMTQKLMDLAGGRVVLILEGGYNLQSISESYLSCLEVMLGVSPSYKDSVTPTKSTLRSTWDVVQKVRSALKNVWPGLDKQSASFEEELEAALLLSIEEKLVHVALSDTESDEEQLEADDGHIQNVENVNVPVEPVITSDFSIQTSGVKIDSQSGDNASGDQHNSKSIDEIVSSLTIDTNGDDTASEGFIATSFNADIEAVAYVWYACYGSNMWKDRFLCYLQGGQVEKMKKKCVGSRRQTPPSATSWIEVGNQMFFGHSYTATWGHGGVAFLESRPTEGVSTHMRLYKIALDQFNDLFMQENRVLDYGSDLIDKSLIDNLSQPSITLLKDCWYGTVLHLGDKDGLPILSITCSEDDLEKFRSGALPLSPPSEEYKFAIAKGLIDDLGLSTQEAFAYVLTKVRKMSRV